VPTAEAGVATADPELDGYVIAEPERELERQAA